MAVAIKDLKKTKPTKIVVAIPVVPEEIALRIAGSVDELVSLRIEKILSWCRRLLLREF
jgi:predicted phosphoribosyltransferase